MNNILNMIKNYTNIISLGDHCAIPMILNELNLRKKSYPFDWYVCAGANIYNSNIEFNINLLFDLLNEKKINNIVNELLGSCICDKTTVFNNLWFPHEKGSIEEINNKYYRRFSRLKEDINNNNNINIFILLTRKNIIDENVFNLLYDKIINLNNKNKIIFISGIDHKYLNTNKYSNLIFKYIDYDVDKFDKYDYTNFRPQIKYFLQTLFSQSNNLV